MGFWRQCKEGLRLTFSEVGWSGVVVGTGSAIALFLQWLQGSEDAFSQLMTYIRSLGWGFAGLVVVFLFRVLRTVPLNELQNENLKLQTEVATLRKQVEQASSIRRLSGEQQARIAELIRDWKRADLKEVNVLYSPITTEAQDFAADIGDAIATAGVKSVVHTGVFFEHDPKARGLQIRHGEDRAEMAKELQQRFCELGVQASRWPESDPNCLFLYVARSV